MLIHAPTKSVGAFLMKKKSIKTIYTSNRNGKIVPINMSAKS